MCTLHQQDPGRHPPPDGETNHDRSDPEVSEEGFDSLRSRLVSAQDTGHELTCVETISLF